MKSLKVIYLWALEIFHKNEHFSSRMSQLQIFMISRFSGHLTLYEVIKLQEFCHKFQLHHNYQILYGLFAITQMTHFCFTLHYSKWQYVSMIYL